MMKQCLFERYLLELFIKCTFCIVVVYCIFAVPGALRLSVLASPPLSPNTSVSLAKGMVQNESLDLKRDLLDSNRGELSLIEGITRRQTPNSAQNADQINYLFNFVVDARRCHWVRGNYDRPDCNSQCENGEIMVRENQCGNHACCQTGAFKYCCPKLDSSSAVDTGGRDSHVATTEEVDVRPEPGVVLPIQIRLRIATPGKDAYLLFRMRVAPQDSISHIKQRLVDTQKARQHGIASGGQIILSRGGSELADINTVEFYRIAPHSVIDGIVIDKGGQSELVEELPSKNDGEYLVLDVKQLVEQGTHSFFPTGIVRVHMRPDNSVQRLKEKLVKASTILQHRITSPEQITIEQIQPGGRANFKDLHPSSRLLEHRLQSGDSLLAVLRPYAGQGPMIPGAESAVKVTVLVPNSVDPSGRSQLTMLPVWLQPGETGTQLLQRVERQLSTRNLGLNRETIDYPSLQTTDGASVPFDADLVGRSLIKPNQEIILTSTSQPRQEHQSDGRYRIFCNVPELLATNGNSITGPFRIPLWINPTNNIQNIMENLEASLAQFNFKLPQNLERGVFVNEQSQQLPPGIQLLQKGIMQPDSSISLVAFPPSGSMAQSRFMPTIAGNIGGSYPVRINVPYALKTDGSRHHFSGPLNVWVKPEDTATDVRQRLQDLFRPYGLTLPPEYTATNAHILQSLNSKYYKLPFGEGLLSNRYISPNAQLLLSTAAAEGGLPSQEFKMPHTRGLQNPVGRPVTAQILVPKLLGPQCAYNRPDALGRGFGGSIAGMLGGNRLGPASGMFRAHVVIQPGTSVQHLRSQISTMIPNQCHFPEDFNSWFLLNRNWHFLPEKENLSRGWILPGETLRFAPTRGSGPAPYPSHYMSMAGGREPVAQLPRAGVASTCPITVNTPITDSSGNPIKVSVWLQPGMTPRDAIQQIQRQLSQMGHTLPKEVLLKPYFGTGKPGHLPLDADLVGRGMVTPGAELTLLTPGQAAMRAGCVPVVVRLPYAITAHGSRVEGPLNIRICLLPNASVHDARRFLLSQLQPFGLRLPSNLQHWLNPQGGEYPRDAKLIEGDWISPGGSLTLSSTPGKGIAQKAGALGKPYPSSGMLYPLMVSVRDGIVDRHGRPIRLLSPMRIWISPQHNTKDITDEAAKHLQSFFYTLPSQLHQVNLLVNRGSNTFRLPGGIPLLQASYIKPNEVVTISSQGGMGVVPGPLYPGGFQSGVSTPQPAYPVYFEIPGYIDRSGTTRNESLRLKIWLRPDDTPETAKHSIIRSLGAFGYKPTPAFAQKAVVATLNNIRVPSGNSLLSGGWVAPSGALRFVLDPQTTVNGKPPFASFSPRQNAGYFPVKVFVQSGDVIEKTGGNPVQVGMPFIVWLHPNGTTADIVKQTQESLIPFGLTLADILLRNGFAATLTPQGNFLLPKNVALLSEGWLSVNSNVNLFRTAAYAMMPRPMFPPQNMLGSGALPPAAGSPQPEPMYPVTFVIPEYIDRSGRMQNQPMGLKLWLRPDDTTARVKEILAKRLRDFGYRLTPAFNQQNFLVTDKNIRIPTDKPLLNGGWVTPGGAVKFLLNPASTRSGNPPYGSFNPQHFIGNFPVKLYIQPGNINDATGNAVHIPLPLSMWLHPRDTTTDIYTQTQKLFAGLGLTLSDALRRSGFAIAASPKGKLLIPPHVPILAQGWIPVNGNVLLTRSGTYSLMRRPLFAPLNGVGAVPISIQVPSLLDARGKLIPGMREFPILMYPKETPEMAIQRLNAMLHPLGFQLPQAYLKNGVLLYGNHHHIPPNSDVIGKGWCVPNTKLRLSDKPSRGPLRRPPFTPIHLAPGKGYFFVNLSFANGTIRPSGIGALRNVGTLMMGIMPGDNARNIATRAETLLQRAGLGLTEAAKQNGYLLVRQNGNYYYAPQNVPLLSQGWIRPQQDILLSLTQGNGIMLQREGQPWAGTLPGVHGGIPGMKPRATDRGAPFNVSVAIPGLIGPSCSYSTSSQSFQGFGQSTPHSAAPSANYGQPYRAAVTALPGMTVGQLRGMIRLPSGCRLPNNPDRYYLLRSDGKYLIDGFTVDNAGIKPNDTLTLSPSPGGGIATISRAGMGGEKIAHLIRGGHLCTVAKHLCPGITGGMTEAKSVTVTVKDLRDLNGQPISHPLTLNIQVRSGDTANSLIELVLARLPQTVLRPNANQIHLLTPEGQEILANTAGVLEKIGHNLVMSSRPGHNAHVGVGTPSYLDTNSNERNRIQVVTT